MPTYQDIYGSGTPTARAPSGERQPTSVATWRQQLGLDDLERQHGLPSGLMTSILRQESGGDPRAKSSAGAQGLFQFMPATAAQYKIDPFDPQQAALAAAQELRTLYKKYGGDVDRTLAAWNWGQGNVDRQGMGRMPQETRGFLANVKRFLSPGVAEAATPGSRVLSYQDIYGAPPTPQPTPAPTPPAPTPPAPTIETATPQEAQATVERLRTRQAEAATPESRLQRFQQLPAITALSPEERQAALAEFQGLQEAQQRAILASEPAADITQAVQEGPRPTPEQQLQQQPTVRPPTETPMANRGVAPGVVLPVPPADQPLEEQNPVQKWIDTGLDVGYGLVGGVVGGATGGLPGMIAGPVVAQGTLDRARMQLGIRPQEKPVWELGPVNVYQSDLLNAGFSLLLGTPDIVKSALSRTQAGKAIQAADDATRAAHEEWKSAVQEARAAQQAGRREAYQTAERKALDANARYQERVRARDQTIRENQQTYDEALTQYKQDVEQARTQSYRETRQEITQQQAQYQGQVARQTSDIQAQGQAIQTARAVPGRYSPETPSWVLYEKFGDAAKNEVIDLTPAKAGLAEVRASRGVLPDGTARPFPAAVEQIASSLEKAEGSASVQTIREELRRLGPLTRSADGNIRGPAKQLYSLYADALEASPVANDLLRQANATFRREMALQDVSDWLRPGRGIVRIDQQGRETINVGALLTRLEKTIGEDTLFARSFSPDDLAALRQDFGRLAGTPRMPTGTPRAPQPESLPGSAPDVAARLRQPPEALTVPAEVARPRVEALPGSAGPGRRMPETPPEPAPVTPRQALGARPAIAGPRAGTWGAILASATAMGVPLKMTAPAAALAVAHTTQKQVRWLMSNALLSPRLRPLVEAAMDSHGRLDRRVYGALKAALSPEEKKQFVRETR